ncbi:MAG: hypothetical protein ACLTG4_07335 [Oscillospiraceae bacterium]
MYELTQVAGNSYYIRPAIGLVRLNTQTSASSTAMTRRPGARCARSSTPTSGT